MSCPKGFLCAAADSAYTERYMGLPNGTGNYRGYEESDLTRRVEHLKDKGLYLVHGTADDNVHLQHGLRFARALSEAGIVYTQQVRGAEGRPVGTEG